MKVTINVGLLKPGDEEMLIRSAFLPVEIPEGENALNVCAMDFLTVFSDAVGDKPEGFTAEDIVFHIVVD